MRPLATPPTPSAPSGQRRFVQFPRSQLRSTLPLLDVPRNQGRSVLLLDVDSRKERKNVMTRLRQLFRTLPRNSVHWSHRGPANRSPNLWSRNGVMFLLRNLAWLNSTTDIMDTWILGHTSTTTNDTLNT